MSMQFFEDQDRDQAYRHGLVDGRNGRPNPTPYQKHADDYRNGYNAGAPESGFAPLNADALQYCR